MSDYLNKEGKPIDIQCLSLSNEKQKETQDLLNTATVKLNSCLADQAAATARLEGLKEQLADMRGQKKKISPFLTRKN